MLYEHKEDLTKEAINIFSVVSPSQGFLQELSKYSNDKDKDKGKGKDKDKDKN